MALRSGKPGRERLELWAQKAQLSLTLFARNEIGVQAAAAAYYCLLSAAPMLLFAALALDAAARVGRLGPAVTALLGPLADAVASETLRRLRPVSAAAGALGLLSLASLLWGSRLVFSALQKTLALIFPSQSPRPAVLVNIVAVLLVPLLLLALAAAALAVAALGRVAVGRVATILVAGATRLAPGALMFAAGFASYRLLPPSPPRPAAAAEGAAFAAVVMLAFRELSGLVFRTVRYDLISGLFGSSILALVTVYFAVAILYLGGEVAYVSDRIDALLVERMYRLGLGRKTRSARPARLERWLFREPARLLARYARAYKPGDLVIAEGADDREVFYIRRGEVRVLKNVRGSTVRLHAMGEGEFFGEMSYLLNERRTAGVVAETECLLLALSPDLFEELLRISQEVCREVIRDLCVRLKASTAAAI